MIRRAKTPAESLQEALAAWTLGDLTEANRMACWYKTQRDRGEANPRIDMTFSDARTGAASSIDGDAFVRLLLYELASKKAFDTAAGATGEKETP